VNSSHQPPEAEPAPSTSLFHREPGGIGSDAEFFSTLMRVSPDHIYFKDRQSRFIRINEKLARHFGIAHPSEAIGKTDFDFFDSKHSRAAFDDEQHLMANGQALIGVEEEEDWRDGHVTWVSTTKVPIQNDAGEVVGILGISRDITARKIAEAALRKTNEELRTAKDAAEMANLAKSEFLANMSHEIRTPMNAILGFSELLANKVRDPRHLEYVQAVHSSGKSLLNLINDILDLSKVEAGKLNLELTAIDPSSILRELQTVFSRKVEEKGLIYTTDVANDFPKAVVLDETRLRQVLLNLIGNAIKFTEYGFVRVVARTEMGATDNELRLVFEVHDSGIGIPEDQRGTIFGAFEQQRGQSHAKYGGTGLGLAISKRLVDLMGGKISVESTVGKGSIFRVTLFDVEEALMAESHPLDSSDSNATILFEPATILVAEDVLLNRELIHGFLADLHLEIVEATNGRDAVKLAREKKPALILMDIKMPELDGFQASAILKDDPSTASIPIVAVTASTMKMEEERIKTVCDGFLRKPIGRTDLLNLLRRFLQHTMGAPVAAQASPGAEEAFCSLDAVQVHDPEGLRRRLETELVPLWTGIQDVLIVNQVLEFAEKAIAIAVTHKATRLANWADKLRNDASLFDMHGMEQTLAQFPDFLAQL